jgi:hypothetical protein
MLHNCGRDGKHKNRNILLGSRRDRFGKTKFERNLQNSWIQNKKYEFLQRELGLREEPFGEEKLDVHLKYIKEIEFKQ